MNSSVIHGENCYSGQDDDSSPWDQIQPVFAYSDQLLVKQTLPYEPASRDEHAFNDHLDSRIEKAFSVNKSSRNELVHSRASISCADYVSCQRAQPDLVPPSPIPITERIGFFGLVLVAVASVTVLLLAYAQSFDDDVMPSSTRYSSLSPSLTETAIGAARANNQVAAVDLARAAPSGEIRTDSQQRNRRTASLPEEPEVSGDIASPSAMIEPTSSTLPERNTAPSAILPPGVPPTAVVAPSDSAVELTEDEMSRWISRGNDLLNSGDFAAARLLFKRAADGGSAQAALALGSSYDPAIIRQLGAVTITPDIDRALKWYATAADLGSADAADRYASLMQAR